MTRERKAIRTYSLKSRVTAAFLISSLITFALVASASYYTIYFIAYNKVERSIDLTMEQLVKDLNMTLDNMTLVSHQLSYGGALANDLYEFLTSDSYAAKRRHYDRINEYMFLIDNTNPNVGLHFYFDEATGERMFPNERGAIADVETLPPLANHAVYEFHGPHPTVGASGNESLVFSLSRPIDVGGELKIRLYMETHADTLRNILEPNRLGMKAAYMLVGPDGVVSYSEIPGYAAGETFDGDGAPSMYGTSGAYGWTLWAAVDDSVFYDEINAWAKRMAALAVGSLLVSLVAGGLVWRAVYGPIRIFRNEIEMMAESRFHSSGESTGVAEFEKVMSQFMRMKEHIRDLLEEVKQKERDKRHLEVDKLLAQINPHFLYNTLNTVQWIARSEGQSTIVKLVANLTQLLRYNLGKEGSVVALEQEIDALKKYVSLQLIRNDYQFHVDFRIDERALQVRIPRFILQPLVENAIYHGLKDGKGTIVVAAALGPNDNVAIEVNDDGGAANVPGGAFEDEPVGEERKYGLGIGLRYVRNMLEVHYGETTTLEIESRPGEGTTYRFAVPAARRESA